MTTGFSSVLTDSQFVIDDDAEAVGYLGEEPEPEISPEPNRFKKMVLALTLTGCGLLGLLVTNGEALSTGKSTGASADLTSVKPDGVLGFSSESYLQNVLGGSLQTCSKPGMALTGFTRDGHCADVGDDDQGSHHICIHMKSDFCTVTGQPNWCVESMECMGQVGVCPIGNWCVCQWAFSTYLQIAGGCDEIVDLQCDATNMAAFRAYEASDDPNHAAALACIKTKCGIA